MLTRIYVEAKIVNEDLADQVWAQWDIGLISDDLAAWAWCILVLTWPVADDVRADENKVGNSASC